VTSLQDSMFSPPACSEFDPLAQSDVSIDPLGLAFISPSPGKTPGRLSLRRSKEMQIEVQTLSKKGHAGPLKLATSPATGWERYWPNYMGRCDSSMFCQLLPWGPKWPHQIVFSAMCRW
jgi:hypothetical protein